MRTLESGVRLEIFELGSGARPEPGRYVAIEYEAFLAEGRSSLGTNREGEPFVFRMVDDSTAIPGLREAVGQLSEGARARVHIPAEHAYGKVGKRPIPPDADLIYELELRHVFERSDSGLQYVVLDPGDDPLATDGDHVVIDYRGILLETDREFASTRRNRNRNEEFILGQKTAIRGWEEGLRLLGRGGRAWLVVPADLAYGPRGRPPAIPGPLDLFYDITLKGIRNRR